ncbi:MAG: FGGY-family carbohydrate kinase [Lachnospiraceae bacterium]
MDERRKKQIEEGRTALGIELGSTRIKAVLVGEDNVPLAAGSHEWENRLENGIWTYTLDDIWRGLRDCYKKLAQEVHTRYGVILRKTGAMGFSAMMHGYMVFDKDGELLVPFRTWRNTMTAEAAERLTTLFGYPIPQRWSIAHLYQAILNKESHIPKIACLTTLAGYVHWKLTGRKVLGVGEASGMFPIDTKTGSYQERMMAQFDALSEAPWRLRDILPSVLTAGEAAGKLTEEGARLLDADGNLEAGILFCPPEGDAGTGMVATNSVAKRTGNISAGTSVFAMVVLEKELTKAYEEIDLVTTPSGEPVAMVHCNNCTSDLNAWVNLFAECLDSFGCQAGKDELYGTLYKKALEGEADCGGLLAYNYVSGEPVTGFDEGRALFVRTPKARFTLANFMRVHLFTSLGALKTGMDILLKKENVKIDRLLGHGGLYKTPGVGQRVTAAAMNAPVSVMETAGEGGAWGIALLASYMLHREEGETLAEYLSRRVFADTESVTVKPKPSDVAGFEAFMERYTKGLAIEKAAIESLSEV